MVVRGIPKSVVDNGQTKQDIGIIQLQKGIYMVTRTDLKKDNVMRIDFKINWDVVDKQEQLHA